MKYPQPSPYRPSKTGFDPEIFVVDGQDKLLPAFTFLPDKHHPHKYLAPISSVGGTPGSVYWDGFQAEFTTTPFHCHEYCTDQLHYGMTEVLKLARAAVPDAKLTLKNVFEIPSSELQQFPFECVNLGCDTSQNAYEFNPFLCDNPFEMPYRMAGGHLHFEMLPASYLGRPSDWTPWVKQLDLLLALPMVGVFANIDNPIRRRYYGKAGEYRTPKHGLEYRTLSNAWLGHPTVSNLVMDLGRSAVCTPYVNAELLGLTDDTVRHIINEGNFEEARAVVKKHSELWRTIFEINYRHMRCFDNFMMLVEEGVESKFPTFSDIEGNWRFDLDRFQLNYRGKGILPNRQFTHPITMPSQSWGSLS